MATVRSIISDLERDNTDWTRQDLLYFFNFCYTILMGHQTHYTQAFDAEGRDPEITPTVAEHTIADADMIAEVYTLGNRSGNIGHIHGNTITFTESQLNITYRVRYYLKPTEYTDESQTVDFPSDQLDKLNILCNAWLAYKQHGSPEEWLAVKKKITKDFWYELNKNYTDTRMNDRNVVSRDSYTYPRSRYGRGRSYRGYR
jgi:hypothetical protein